MVYMFGSMYPCATFPDPESCVAAVSMSDDQRGVRQVPQTILLTVFSAEGRRVDIYSL